METTRDRPPAYLIIKDWSRQAPSGFSVLELSFFRYVVLENGWCIGVKRTLGSALRLARKTAYS